MATLIPIFLVSENQATLETVKGALAAEGETLAATLRHFHELDRALSAEDAALVLVDLDPQPLVVLTELEPVINVRPHSRFVGLTSQRTPQLIMRAMQAGVRHVQLKQDIAEELGSVARQLLSSLCHEPGSRGLLLPVLSAGGGCGATTLAIGVACELQRLGGGPTLLVDGDFTYGSAGIYLGIENRFGLADILGREAPPDVALVQSTVIHDKSGVDVLVSPVAGAPGRPGHFSEFLDVCRRGWSSVVLDLPRPSRELLEPAVQAAGVVLVVMQAAVRDFRVAQMLLGHLSHYGVGPSRIVLALNRHDRRYGVVPLKEIELAFQPVPVVCIHNDTPSATRAVTAGRPLGILSPRAAPARDITHLAELCLSLAGKLKGEVRD